ncbi:MAG: glycosyltransferase, partial [Acetobacteraceae bacterium]|nr:glycosyltransferase [Acetobacteraceae bacterium]
MISVVIPALNEAARLPRLLRALRAEPVRCETVVVDGGSEDGTPEVAREAGAALVLSAPRGRGQQMAVGAAAARGSVLLFLHADTTFPAGGLLALTELLQRRPEVVG